jgi:hypothetical protein
MDVSDNSILKNKIVEALLNRDSITFHKCLQESIMHTEQKLVETYSNQIKESLNG